MLIRLPNSLPFEQSAQLPVSAFTTCQVLWQSQDLPRIFESSQESSGSDEPTTVLVWSGAAATGHYVIQFAKMAGMRVITTASPKHFDRLKQLGADECFDYNDPEVADKIRKATGYGLKHAVDCISQGSTLQKVNDCMGDEGGVISCILGHFIKDVSFKEGVTVRSSLGFNFLGEVRIKPLYSPEHTFTDFSYNSLSRINFRFFQRCAQPRIWRLERGRRT
jgi:NADPH:quinone reductase-like Zn-dependent oxidoreductase